MRLHLAYVLGLVACGAVQPSGDGPQVLSVSVAGGGSVTSNPTGISCGTTCTAEFDPGASVTLTATADGGSAFLGWGGDCSGADACTVTMDRARTVTAGFAPHGAKRWVAQIGFSGQDTIDAMQIAPDGNVIVGGMVQDANGSYPYIVKYAKTDGSIIWMNKLAIGDSSAYFGGLAVDAAGDVYFALRLLGFGATVTIGTQTVAGDFLGNIVVARLAAATGAPVWAKQWGGDGQDEPMALAVSGTDLYVVGGSSSAPATFDTLSLSGSTNDGFVVRASTDTGTATRLKHFDGSVELFGVAVNAQHIAVVGQVRSAVAIDTRCSVTPSGTGSDALFVDLLGASLDCQWAKGFGDFTNGKDATAQSVAAFPGGGWVIIGDFTGNILLATSGSSLTSRGGFDVFAGRFTGDGSHVWSFRYGDIGFDLGYGVAVTPEGNTILAGTFDTTITFGTATVTGVNNAFVTRMSAGMSPTHEWAVSLGGNDTDQAQDVAVAPDGSVYVLSQFTGMTNIAGTALTSQDYDAWIAALVR